MSVTPQTNEPEVPEDLPAVASDPAALPASLFDRPNRPEPVDDVEEQGTTLRPASSIQPVDRDGKAPQLEARVVTRLVRHVSPWSVLKVSALLYLSMYVVLLLAGTGLWLIASDRGVIGSFESFMDELLAEESFQVHGAHVFRMAATIGIFGVVVASALSVLFSIIFNLISDITGGFRVSVVELETARPRRRARR